LRGWGAEDFRRAGAELLGAARWALYADKAVVMLHEAEQTAAMDVSGVKGKALGDVLRAKLAGRKLADALRPVLFPEDDDG
jgi:hypothetical protein